MVGRLYIVKKGDTLWDISQRFLGDPRAYHLIYKHNNIPLITALTKSKIVDVDLIFVGQKIYIPELNSKMNPSLTDNEIKLSDSKAKQSAKNILYPEFKYTIGRHRITSMTRGVSITISLTGSVTLKKKGVLNALAISKENVEINLKQLKYPYDKAYEELVHGSPNSYKNSYKISINTLNKSISFENALTINSKNKQPVKSSISFAISGGRLAIKAKFSYSCLSGEFGEFYYKTDNFAVEIEIAMDNKDEIDRKKAECYANFAIGFAIVTATLVENFETLGIGILDDPICFMYANKFFTNSILNGFRMRYISSGIFSNGVSIIH